MGTVVQDSTTEVKFSTHVLVKSIAFQDNQKAKQFVAMFIAYLRKSRQPGNADGSGTSLLFTFRDKDVFNIEGSGIPVRGTPVVDTSVYSRNRCFRVLRQSKHGKNTTLKLQDGGSA